MLMTVEELAVRSGLSVRNIRAYQSHGLLQPPGRFEERRRLAAYGDEHLDRLELIKDLRERGFTLKAIAKMLDVSGNEDYLSTVLETLREFRRESSPVEPFVPVELSSEELVNLLGELTESPPILTRLITLGLLEPRGESYLLNAPELFEAGRKLIEAGIPLEVLLDALDHLQQGIRFALEVLGESFRKLVWEPNSAAGAIPEHMASTISLIGDLPALTRKALDAAIEHELRNAPLVRLFTRGIPDQA